MIITLALTRMNSIIIKVEAVLTSISSSRHVMASIIKLPVSKILICGVLNLEFMTFETLLADEVYEFMFVFTPLRLKGATGSPGRPLAIR